jgi:DNA-binding NtrC family response regulator
MSESQGQYRICVVDDEPNIATTLGLILKLQGFEVSIFTNPLRALEAINTLAPNFLISDVVMPEMSGIDLAIAIRETCPSCTVLLFSGQPSTAQLMEAASNRGHDFEVLSKPIHPGEILSRVFSGFALRPRAGKSTEA